MTTVLDTTSMLKGRVRGGMSTTNGVLLYTDRAWGAARIEEDATTSTAGGPLVLPAWLDHRALSPLRAMALFRRAGRAADRFWKDGDDESTSRYIPVVGTLVLLALAGVVAAIPGLLVPAWPWREAAQGVALFLAHFSLYLLVRTSDGTRVPMLHGAEHMCAACLDDGQPLTRRAASRFPACHARCGSNLMVTLYGVGTVVHVLLGLLPLGLPAAVALRLLALPVVLLVTTIAHRLLAKLWDVPVLGAVAVPGRYIQRLSVAEPDAASLEVAMAAGRALMAADCAVAHGAVIDLVAEERIAA